MSPWSEGGAAKTLCIPFVQPPLPPGRGLHSSTFRLNLGAFYGTGVHFGGVLEVSWGINEYQGAFRVHFVSETAQIELRSGRV